MSGPPPKPDHRRQRKNSRPTVEVTAHDGRIVQIPPAPKHLLRRTREKWHAYWCSNVAQVIELDSDLPAVERLFQLYDERLRAYEGYRKNRLVLGSQGQPVLNPLASMIKQCDQEIRALEDRLGLNAKARLQLGITLTEAKKGLDDLNRSLEPTWDDDEDEGEEEQAAQLRSL